MQFSWVEHLPEMLNTWNFRREEMYNRNRYNNTIKTVNRLFVFRHTGKINCLLNWTKLKVVRRHLRKTYGRQLHVEPNELHKPCPRTPMKINY